ncbi:MAG: alpha/beta hydrolase [Chitinophagaceae bacterium]
MKSILPIICSVFILLSCKKEEGNSDQGTTADVEKNYTDIGYGDDAKQKMDIYLPAKRTESKTKTLVLIHGGGWTEGDKSDMTAVVDSLKLRLPDYAFININYRLAFNSTTNLFPTQENDVETAIDFYLNKSSEYKVSNDLIVSGASAGGHLALLYSYKDDVDKHVKAVIDFFGPTDLVALWNAGLTQQLILASVTGKLYDQDHELYNQASPINFVTAQSPSTIVLQGGADPLVPATQSTSLIAKLQANSVANQLVFYEGGGHGNWPAATYSDAFNKIQKFIIDNVP